MSPASYRAAPPRVGRTSLHGRRTGPGGVRVTAPSHQSQARAPSPPGGPRHLESATWQRMVDRARSPVRRSPSRSTTAASGTPANCWAGGTRPTAASSRGSAASSTACATRPGRTSPTCACPTRPTRPDARCRSPSATTAPDEADATRPHAFMRRPAHPPGEAGARPDAAAPPQRAAGAPALGTRGTARRHPPPGSSRPTTSTGAGPTPAPSERDPGNGPGKHGSPAPSGPGFRRCSGGRIRTCDLWVMSPASYRAAPPRVSKTAYQPWEEGGRGAATPSLRLTPSVWPARTRGDDPRPAGRPGRPRRRSPGRPAPAPGPRSRRRAARFSGPRAPR